MNIHKIPATLAIVLGLNLLLAVHGGAQGPAPSLGRRVALVMGNGKYLDMSPLPNPANDARALAERLKELGFEVIVQTDLIHAEMLKQLEVFYRRSRGADLALLFYAGHGIRVGGRNYLIPVNALVPDDEAGIYGQAVELEFVVAQMQRASKVGLVLLDACRNNPGLESRLPGVTRDAFRDVRLADALPGGTVLILYATSPGRRALDSVAGKKNSPFAEALLAHLGERDPVEVVARRVSGQVAMATGRRQQPEVQGSLNDDVYLAGRCPAGTHLEEKTCVADVRRECPKGYRFSEGDGCVPVLVGGPSIAQIVPNASPKLPVPSSAKPTTQVPAYSRGPEPTKPIDIQAGRVFVEAKVEGRSGSSLTGTATFEPQKDGSVLVVLQVQRAKAGLHGVHIHETGDCSAYDAKSAGNHLNPSQREHGNPTSADQHHLGDLGNIVVGADGTGRLRLLSNELSIGTGKGVNSVVDRAIVIHEKPDDMITQPSGNSGPRIGCGVIRYYIEV